VVRESAMLVRMSCIHHAAVAEPETDQDRLATVEQEMIFAEEAFNLAAINLRKYNLANQQMPIVFRTENVTRIQTMVNNFERVQLERSERSAFERRNKALSVRADLLRQMGRIR
jgi:hypothetical protein